MYGQDTRTPIAQRSTKEEAKFAEREPEGDTPIDPKEPSKKETIKDDDVIMSKSDVFVYRCEIERSSEKLDPVRVVFARVSLQNQAVQGIDG